MNTNQYVFCLSMGGEIEITAKLGVIYHIAAIFMVKIIKKVKTLGISCGFGRKGVYLYTQFRPIT